MKPFEFKNYGSIPHLPGSRTGSADKTINPGQTRIVTEKARDKHDVIIVQEKLDGSNVGVIKHEGQLIALTRSGNLARSSKFIHHQHFAYWVDIHWDRFNKLLKEGERICGEWLGMAHGTIYELKHEPFVAFDIFTPQNRRIIWRSLHERLDPLEFVMPDTIHIGEPISIQKALSLLDPATHGAVDPIEGCVWRCERNGHVDFLCKYVRPDKVDGKYLDQEIFFWKP